MKLATTILALLLAGGTAYAQPGGNHTATAPKPTPAPVNLTDGRGKPNGMWVIEVAPRMGEPGFTEFGKYDHGRKFGLWYKIDDQGDLLAAETYRNNTLDGEVKYYDRGMLYCIGHYRGLNPDKRFDTIVVVDPTTNLEMLRSIPTERGSLRHGSWQYFEPLNGRLIREEEYQIDELLSRKEYPRPVPDSMAYQKRFPHNISNKPGPPPKRHFNYAD